jgi:hypothetical protein
LRQQGAVEFKTLVFCNIHYIQEDTLWYKLLCRPKAL